MMVAESWMTDVAQSLGKSPEEVGGQLKLDKQLSLVNEWQSSQCLHPPVGSAVELVYER